VGEDFKTALRELGRATDVAIQLVPTQGVRDVLFQVFQRQAILLHGLDERLKALELPMGR